MSKIGTLVTDLSKLKQNKSYNLIPGNMQDKFENTLSKLEEYKREANARLTGVSTDPLDFSSKDVADAFKQGTFQT